MCLEDWAGPGIEPALSSSRPVADTQRSRMTERSMRERAQRTHRAGQDSPPRTEERQLAIPWERRMTEGKRFAQLLKEFERVGVDPNTISAGLAVREEDALRALHALPDNAGPAAFLTQLRLVMTQTTSEAPPPE